MWPRGRWQTECTCSSLPWEHRLFSLDSLRVGQGRKSKTVFLEMFPITLLRTVLFIQQTLSTSMREKVMHKKLVKSLSGIWSPWPEFLSPWSVLCAEYSFRIIIILNKQITYSTCKWVFGVNLYGDNSIPSMKEQKAWVGLEDHLPAWSMHKLGEWLMNYPGNSMYLAW